MLFKEFAVYLSRLEKTSSRLEISAILTELFKKTGPEEIRFATYLSLGTMAPNYEGVLLNVAEKMMLRIISRAYETDESEVKNLYKKYGDIGNVAENLAPEAGSGNLTVNDVYGALREVAGDAGEGSQEKKIEKISVLMKKLDRLSSRFVARIPVGRLRLGFSEKTIIDALSKIDSLDPSDIETAYNIRPDIGYIAEIAKKGEIKNAKPRIGVPVVPMLAQRLNSTSEMVKKMGQVAVEPKFDGLRIFIHYRKKDNFLKIFTRNMNAIDIDTFPELTHLEKHINAGEIILDTEAIGVDPKREMFLDFQKTIQRRRKHGVAESANLIPLQFQVFDILYIDGKSLIHEPYGVRRAELTKAVNSGSLFRVDESTITDDPNLIRELHQKYLKMGLEGIIAKRADGKYVSGRTGWNWVKMKEEEGKRGKLSDTLDCVIMGYTSGKGKRVDFGVGQFLAGVRQGDTFKTITKVGTGLTDIQFRELNSRLKNLISKEKPKEYEAHKDLTPDFWVLPNVIVELAADEITVSPKHTAGYALRFPRLIKFRDDKSPKDATTVEEVKNMVKLQKA
jgi:DNA ligase-1